jgi:hypothetical protein
MRVCACVWGGRFGECERCARTGIRAAALGCSSTLGLVGRLVELRSNEHKCETWCARRVLPFAFPIAGHAAADEYPGIRVLSNHRAGARLVGAFHGAALTLHDSACSDNETDVLSVCESSLWSRVRLACARSRARARARAGIACVCVCVARPVSQICPVTDRITAEVLQRPGQLALKNNIGEGGADEGGDVGAID